MIPYATVTVALGQFSLLEFRLFTAISMVRWSQWERGLRCGSAAACLLWVRVRTPPTPGCLSLVSVVCGQIELSATGRSFVQTNPAKCGVSDKVKCSRFRPGLAQTVGRGIALLFHYRDTGRGWMVSSTPRPHFTPGKDPVPILQEAGWAPGPDLD